MKARISILPFMVGLVFALSSGARAADQGQRAGEEPRLSGGPKSGTFQKGQPETTERGAASGMTGTGSPMKPEATGVQQAQKAKVSELKAAEKIDEPVGSNEIRGVEVKNDKGEDLGIVSELILDPSGRVDFVIVSGEKGLFGEGKKIAVPYRAFRFIPPKGDERVVFVLNLDKEKFVTAPDYRDDPRIFTDEERAARIYRFYGLRPASHEGSVTPYARSGQIDERQEKPSVYEKEKEEGSQGIMGTATEKAPEGHKRY
jgi:sporulation protein YlmC with PRC-barrel domain